MATKLENYNFLFIQLLMHTYKQQLPMDTLLVFAFLHFGLKKP